MIELSYHAVFCLGEEKMVEVNEATSNLKAQKRDCALSGQAAPSEVIAKRLTARYVEIVELNEEFSTSQKRDCASAGQAAPSEVVAKRLTARYKEKWWSRGESNP